MDLSNLLFDPDGKVGLCGFEVMRESAARVCVCESMANYIGGFIILIGIFNGNGIVVAIKLESASVSFFPPQMKEFSLETNSQI